MLVPQTSASKASCNRSPESSLKADMASVIIEFQVQKKYQMSRMHQLVFLLHPELQAGGKERKKRKQNEGKELVSNIMQGNVLQRNTQQQEFEYLESGNEKYSVYILTELNALNVIHQVFQGGCISLWH